MQSEAQIEKTLIDILTERDNQWTYRGDIKTEKALWDNVRSHINRINIAELDGILLSKMHLLNLADKQLKAAYLQKMFV